ncbi:hypothetical protein ASG31_17510 [Chryseobacterium sp. Leaf404]|uniref:hypothetical protein n=1 Tax=unclassified Chryseobacterium TaxID=2593645 RepID=UPI0006F864E4|nr:MULTISPECIES: hypothetical protein [unclassified Chryseobacterium]KQT20565.1 hypothetical protein ASG31_17510 [Chryseobacterium sp. Leaf404]
MKHFYTSKSLLKFSFLFLFVLSVFSLSTSCKEDDEEEFTDHLVQFQVKGLKGGAPAGTEKVVIKTIVTQVGTSQDTKFDPVQPGVLSWQSEEFFVNSSQAQLNLDANAILPNSDSELSVTILVDGEVAVTKKVVGSGNKNVSVDFSFLEL